MNLRELRRRHHRAFVRSLPLRRMIRSIDDAYRATLARYAARIAALKLPPPPDFTEGDYVTRGDDDIHLVKKMAEDRYTAEFECVKAPATGWISVGESEFNLTRRYQRVDGPAQ